MRPSGRIFITVDDMSADSIGAFNCKLAGTSPNNDRLAKEALRFRHAHVQVGNCMPSRNVMWSVRKELAHYYSSVRRADDCVGQVLAALEASGQNDQTVVMFLSDHGMPLPFAKTQLYHHSTHTPLVIRWPGVTGAGAIDEAHMVSAVDFLPTLLDVAGIAHPQGLDGRSFAPLLRGESQADRNMVVKEYNENSGGSRDPMRAIQTRQFLYVFNPWSDGKRIMQTATTGTPTYRRFRQLAATDPVLGARHKLYQYRVVEELYDVRHDPDCLKNLIDDPAYSVQLNQVRKDLEDWMVNTADPMLEVFRRREDASFREAYVQTEERKADERRATGDRKNKKGKAKRAKT